MDNFEEQLENFIRNTDHEYYTTQTKICYFIVERIYKRVLDGYDFGAIKIDEEYGLIKEGNHRYIAYKMAGYDFKIIPWTKNHTDPFNRINDFVIDNEEDWDRNDPEYIKYCTDEFLKDL
ncbi:hypothetical protein [Chryseobacterium gossypii]|uniref:hypothetical protein n=1 Tax=Chryseobacterium gossypii TaxID=3231602 RepID=UPI0035245228